MVERSREADEETTPPVVRRMPFASHCRVRAFEMTCRDDDAVLETARVVEVAFVIVPEVELSVWMVEEPSVMREFGIVTRPMSEIRKKEVVAEPMLFVEEATSKSGESEAKVP